MKNGIKLAVLSAALLAAGGFTAAKPVAAYAEGETEIVSSSAEQSSEEPIVSSYSEEPAAEDEKSPVDELKEWASNEWNTLVVPLISGVSITAVVSLVYTIVLSYVKNKKLDEKLVEVKDNLTKSTEIIAVIKGVYEDLEETKSISEESKKAVESTCSEIISKLNITVEQNETIKKIEPILKLLVQLETKVAESTDSAIKAGIIDDVREIENLIKKF